MNNWTRDEALVAFRIYCHTPFGRLHGRNPEIIQLAQRLGRTPSAVAMKCCNFASLNPDISARGLSNVARIDREIWDDFQNNSSEVLAESETAFQQLTLKSTGVTAEFAPFAVPEGPTEKWAQTRVRIVQSFFRTTVLIGYDFRCAMCGLDLPPLLTASHIIPWSKDENRRADPTNGLSLCALHDRAFDRGFLTVNQSFAIVVSERAKQPTQSSLQLAAFSAIEGNTIFLPARFYPDKKALDYHRQNIFQ